MEALSPIIHSGSIKRVEKRQTRALQWIKRNALGKKCCTRDASRCSPLIKHGTGKMRGESDDTSPKIASIGDPVHTIKNKTTVKSKSLAECRDAGNN